MPIFVIVPSRLLISSLVLLFSPPVRADETDPDVQACEGKQAGDACQRTVVTKPEGGELEERKEPGVCRPDECCELDYSKGSPPATTCGPCLVCKAGPADELEEGAPSGDAAVEAPRVEPGDDPPATAPQEQRGCALGERSRGLWGLLVIVVAWSRRRGGDVRS